MVNLATASHIDSVLVIEPAQRIRANMEITIKQCDYRVALDDGSGGAARVQAEAPDVVLLSCEPLPGGQDSFELCREIMKQHMAPVVVMTSSRPTKQTVLKASRCGAMGFVVLPARGVDLQRKLERIYSQTPEAESRAQFPIIYFGARDITPRQKVDIVMRDVSTIRALPHAVTKILKAATQEESAASDVAKAAQSDPSIAAMILKRANSSYYGGQDPVTDLQAAVVRMGFRECRDQVAGMAVSNLFPRGEKSFGFNRVWYWLHSLGCGLLADRIAKRASFPDKEDAFTVGLLHDIGKIILDDFLNRDYGQVIREAGTTGITLFGAENKTFERTHAFVGSSVAQKWQFPETVCNVLAQHHDYKTIHEAADASLVGAVYLANQMTKATLIGCGGDFVVQDVPSKVWAVYGLESMSQHAMLGLLYEELKEFCAFLQLQGKDVDMALERYEDSGTAVLFEPENHNTWLTSLFLVNQGFEVETISDAMAILQRDEPPKLFVLRPTDIGGAMFAFEQIETQVGGPTPTVCILHPDAADTKLQENRPWLRVIPAPIDFFVSLCKVRELLPGLLPPKIPDDVTSHITHSQ